MTAFPERLNSVFEALGTTPYKFAGQHQFNRASVFNMMNGKTRPNLDMLERLCTAESRISAEYLLRGEGEPLRDTQRAAALSTVEELLTLRDQVTYPIDRRIQELNQRAEAPSDQ